MMKAIILAIAAFCVFGGFFVLVINPRRFTNQVFAFMSLIAAAWLGTVAGAIHAGEQFWLDHTTTPIPWLRANGIISAIFVGGSWLLHESATNNSLTHSFKRCWPVLVGCAAFILIALSDYNVPSDSIPGNAKRGLGYQAFLAFVLISHGLLFARAVRDMRRQTGLRRVQIQFLSLNLIITLALIVLVISIGNALGSPTLRRASSFVFLAGYVIAVWAMALHRIFDARQILLLLAQRLALLAGGTWALWQS